MRKRFLITLLVVAASLIPIGVAAERLPSSLHGGDPFSTVLTGNGSGTARVTLNPGQREVCWEVMVAGLTAPVFASHIHKLPAVGVNGPIVVPFFGFSTPSSASSFSGCTENVDRTLIEDIQDNPAGYYVNVHTTCAGQPVPPCGPDFPVSAVRGPLTHP